MQQYHKIPTIILCGGLGTRLKEETEYRPKPMVEIGERPILWHIMKTYAHYGHNKFILALGYKGNYIKDFFLKRDLLMYNFTLNTKNGEKKFYNRNHEDDFEITFVDTGHDSLTAERILRLKKYLRGNEVFMVTYGDGLTDINIEKLLQFHDKQNTIGTITGINPVSRFGLVKVDQKGIIKGFQQKPKLKEFVNGGYMVFNAKIFSYLRKGEMIEEALLRLVEEKQLSLYPHKGFWFCVDTLRDLEEANRLWRENKKLWAVWE